MNWQADLDLAVNAVRAAGAIVMQTFRTDQEVTFKSPDQPLTQADLAADALLKEKLLGARPDYGWLSEETADTPDRLSKDVVWVVDPIDGTRSYVAGRAEFAISCGVACEGKPVAGVIFNPATNEMFTAVANGGAWRDGARIMLSTATRKPVIAASRSEIKRGEFTPFDESHEILPAGSTAYKLAKVADGTADIFLSRGPKAEWDLCAGALIVHEAGGMVTDLHGRALQYNGRDPHIEGVLAANAALHADMLRRMEKLK